MLDYRQFGSLPHFLHSWPPHYFIQWNSLLLHWSRNPRNFGWCSQIRPKRQKEGVESVCFYLRVYWFVMGFRLFDVPYPPRCSHHHLFDPLHRYNPTSRILHLPVLLREQESCSEMGRFVRKMPTMLQESGRIVDYTNTLRRFSFRTISLCWFFSLWN